MDFTYFDEMYGSYDRATIYVSEQKFIFENARGFMEEVPYSKELHEWAVSRLSVTIKS